MKTEITLDNWGLTADKDGQLQVCGYKAAELAERYGTPLHVINQELLASNARRFAEAAADNYKGKTAVHYAFKCNHIPAVIEVIKKSGLKAEVTTEFEYRIAKMTGYKPSDIIANGPCKAGNFLRELVRDKVKLIIADSRDEMLKINEIAEESETTVSIALRINADYSPRGIIKAATAGSDSSVFGLSIRTGEAERALSLLKDLNHLNFCGFHFHIGSGIKRPSDYKKAIGKLLPVIDYCRRSGMPVRIIDVGGGYHAGTSRELTSWEMFLYHVLNIAPEPSGETPGNIGKFVSEIGKTIETLFNPDELPEIIFEPGRCITSASQMLLLKAHYIKKRNGRKWIITDGGLGTVTLPLFYEYHRIILCSNVYRKNEQTVTITGPCCFSADVVYRNIKLPEIRQGEVLAVLDSGAYFTQLESSFGYPRPAVIMTGYNAPGLVRSRETFDEYFQRDMFLKEV